jgi:hypothetical protein
MAIDVVDAGHDPFLTFSLLISHRQLNRLPPLRHEAPPRSANRKRGIPQQIIRSITAGFMESIV